MGSKVDVKKQKQKAQEKQRKKDKKKEKDGTKAKGAKRRKGSQAERADKYVLYQRAVQEPEADLEFFEEVFAERYGRKPRDLREDFCAAAYTACTWVARHPENRAWGVDLDPEPLAWGREHNAADLSPDALSRLHLVEGDVREVGDLKVDVVAAQNFSYCIFKTRAELRRYFEAVRAGLRDQGVFVLDIFGGPEAQMEAEEETEYEDEGFAYVWDQQRYDAITNEIRCAIHFRFPDGSVIEEAFLYDWRLWTIPELKELLLEAGFSAAEAYWEGTDDEGEGNGEFTQTASAENEDAWIAYVVGFNS